MIRKFLLLGSISLVVIGTAGCVTMRAVEPDRNELRADRATIALTLDSSDLAIGTRAPDGWQLAAVSMRFAQSQEVRLATRGSGVDPALIETTSDKVGFRDLRVTWKVDDRVYESYRALGAEHDVDVRPGEFAYLGNLRISDVRFNDAGIPESMQACFEDSWEEDSEVWSKLYPVIRFKQPERRISPCWGGGNKVMLTRLRPKYGGTNIGSRYFRPTPPPSPRPDNNPAGGGPNSR